VIYLALLTNTFVCVVCCDAGKQLLEQVPWGGRDGTVHHDRCRLVIKPTVDIFAH